MNYKYTIFVQDIAERKIAYLTRCNQKGSGTKDDEFRRAIINDLLKEGKTTKQIREIILVLGL